MEYVVRCSYLNSLAIQWPKSLQTAACDKHRVLIFPNVERSDFTYKTLSCRLTSPSLALRTAEWQLWAGRAQDRIRGLYFRARAGLDEVMTLDQSFHLSEPQCLYLQRAENRLGMKKAREQGRHLFDSE